MIQILPHFHAHAYLLIYLRKGVLRDKWNNRITDGVIQYKASGKGKRASYEMVVEWITIAWRKVANCDAILKGFKECGYIGYDGNVERLHSGLRDTMVNREVPPEVIAELNEFFIRLQEEINETPAECDLDESMQSGEIEKDKTDEEDDVDIEIV